MGIIDPGSGPRQIKHIAETGAKGASKAIAKMESIASSRLAKIKKAKATQKSSAAKTPSTNPRTALLKRMVKSVDEELTKQIQPKTEDDRSRQREAIDKILP